VTVMSREQSAIGYDANVVIADDILDENGFKDPVIRDEADHVLRFYALRAGGGGQRGPVLVVMSRGDLDDPYGRRQNLKAVTWEQFSKPAILDYGEPTERAFAPEVWSLSALKNARAEEYERDPSLRDWESQWMGNPLAFAEGFFEGQTQYVGEAPRDATRIVGVDAAFTQGKKSDYFAAVVMAYVDGRCVVERAIRHRRGLSQAIETLEQLHSEFPEARFVSYTSGPEVGVYHHIFELTQGRVCVETMQARWNKATRAGKSAQAWRAGMIPVRLGEPWSGIYLGEMHSYSGGENGVDDQVDATVSAYDAMQLGKPAEGFESSFAFGRPCM